MSTKINSSIVENSEMHARKADLIDQHVGKKLREHRRMLEMSQQDVSELLGISYQQIQKYESGVNRISAGRLYTLAHIMQIPVHKFYEGLPVNNHTASDNIGANSSMGANKTPEVLHALDALVHAIQRAS